LKKKRIILGVTGSIAAYKAAEVISALKKCEIDVTVVMTKEAAHFITPLTLQTLSGNKVYEDMFNPVENWEPRHISLAQSADLILICPATAAIIGKLSNGICDDLLSCVVISSKAKVLLAPAMNENMYLNPIVTKNITFLKKTGYKFIGPIRGQLACGVTGIGHLASVSTIVGAVKKELKTKNKK